MLFQIMSADALPFIPFGCAEILKIFYTFFANILFCEHIVSVIIVISLIPDKGHVKTKPSVASRCKFELGPFLCICKTILSFSTIWRNMLKMSPLQDFQKLQITYSTTEEIRRCENPEMILS